ncbi:hypothetical protein JCM8547_002600 [Rhodosporidiobolus lusitaniae]
MSTLSAGFSLVGGVPTRGQDLAASVVFTVTFGLLLLLAVYRWSSPTTRTWVLLRPTIVAVIRIVTYIIRCIEAKGDYDTGLFIGEQILVLSGLIPLVEPNVALLKFHARRNWALERSDVQQRYRKQRSRLNRALSALQIGILVAVILGIVAGTKSGDAIDDLGVAAEVKRYRYAAIGLTLFVIGTSALLTCLLHLREKPPLAGTLYLLVCSGLLLIPNIYKLDTSLHPPSPLSAGTKVGFYLLSALPELVVILIYLSTNLNDLYDIPEGRWKHKVEKMMRKGEWPEGLGYVSRAEYEREHNRSGTLELGAVGKA